MTRAEEQRLIARAAAGDRTAAEVCIRAHQASLYAYILRMSGRPEIAEDIVQDAFVRVLANLDRYDPRFRFSTWLFTITKRLYVNWSQRHKPTYDTDALPDHAARTGSGRTPDSPAVDAEVETNLRDAVQAVLLRLPPDQREIIILFHQLDWPIWLIAQHMEMPEGTVKSHLHRGRRKMRRMIEEHETYSRHVGEVWT